MNHQISFQITDISTIVNNYFLCYLQADGPLF